MLRAVPIALCAVLLSASPAAAARWTLESPDAVLRATLSVRGGQTSLKVRRGQRTEITARLGSVPAGRPAVARTRVREQFTTPSGKRRSHRLDARRLRLRYAGRRAIEVLVARDGVAFRQTGDGSERSAWRVPGAARGWLQPLTFNYEAPYRSTRLDTAPRRAYAFPVLLRGRRGGYALLTEAGLDRGNPGAHLRLRSGRELRVALPPSRRATDRSGWRIAVLGDLGTIVESDLPLALGRPARLADTSWIRPGRVAWSWWSQPASPGDLEVQKRYVEFAAARRWEYVLVDEGWNAADLPELVVFARAHSVRVLLWTDWRALADARRRRAVLDRWAGWGVAGIKADFLHSDAGSRMAVMEAIAGAAARRRMVVSFHGSTAPRGWQRTHPNVLTSEGVLGAEHARSGDWPGPAHDVTLAFTRNAIGAMDYTPVAFSASGSEAHALAQAIVFESGLQHYADAPERYAERPAALELLEAVPAAWDETRLLRGAPDRSVTLARRSAGEWFVGSLHAGGPRTARARLDFLRPGRQYEATVTADGPAGLEVTRRTVTVQSTLTLPVARDGGFAVRLEPR